MSISYTIDPLTKDYVVGPDGQLVMSSDPSPEIVLAIGEDLNGFHGDPDLGSAIGALLQGNPPADIVASLISAASDAMGRLEQQGMITIQAIDATAGGTIRVDVVQLPGTLEIPA